MAKISFVVKPSGNNKMQIRASLHEGDKRMYRNIGETIPAGKVKDSYRYWDSSNQKVKGLDAAGRINAKMDKMKSAFTHYVDEQKRKYVPVDIEAFLQMQSADIVETDRDNTPLLTVIISFIDAVKTTHKKISIKAYTVLKCNIEAYQKATGITIIAQKADRVFFKKFSAWLMEDREKIKGNHNSTINKKQSQLRTILNYAKEELKLKIDVEKKHKFKEVPANKFALRPEELATLQAHIPANEYHRMVLDAFLLSCETGLRHSDIVQLKEAHIVAHLIDDNIISVIDLTNIKGAKNNNMALSDRGKEIVDRYSMPDQCLFKFHHSQVAGKVLKTIFKAAGLNRSCELKYAKGADVEREMKPLHEVISFHMARNTYITRLLAAGLSPALVQGNAGHSKVNITMGYSRLEEAQRWKETLRIQNKL